jgi:large subunit ribosomal protein L17
MRHAVKGRKLGRTTAHREALFRNQLQSLVARERIVTTLPKAKELRPLAEKMVTRGKHGTVHARRWVLRWVNKRDLVKKVFDEIAPRFSARPGGYLRIVKLGPRLGDGAEMAVLEFVDRSEEAAPVKEEAKGGAAKAKKAKPKKEAKPAAEKQAAKKPARGKKAGEAAPAQPAKKAVRTRRGQES